MSTLLLFPFAFYSGDPRQNCWNEIAGSTAGNFNKDDLLYKRISELKQLCPYLQSIHNFDNFLFLRNSRQKLQSFHFLKKLLFLTEWLKENESWRVLSDLSRLFKSLVTQLFSQHCQIYMNLKVKVVQNSMAHKNTLVILW